MSFPSTLDNLATTRGGAGQTLSSPNHVTHHIAEDTAIQALQTKVGIDSSADTNSLDYKVANRIPLSYIDTDVTLSANSDSKLATQKAVKAYAQPVLGYTAENLANKGIASGYASLDSGGKIPSSQLPASVTGAMNYRGVWDCSTAVYPSSPSAGYYYIASVAGTISGTAYLVGDWLAYNGTSWDKIDNQTIVSSVNGEVGAVVLTTNEIADATNYRYVTDAQLVVIGNTSGTNTGDNAVNTLYSGLVSNATHTGDATGSTALTVVKINGVSLAGLATGILKNTTTTGEPSIAVAGVDYLAPNGSASALTSFPTLNQNTTGTASNITGTLAIANGGTNMTAYSVGGVMVCNTVDVLEMVTSVTGTKVLTNTAGVISWEVSAVAMVAPPSSTDNAIARYDGTTGALLQNSVVTITDLGSINIPAGEQYLVDGSPLVSSLQGAYDGGNMVTTAGGLPITFYSPVGSNTVGLLITQSDVTNNKAGLVIDNTGTGNDITGNAWNMTVGGVLTVTGITLGVAINDILDEDDMVSDSASALATQQSIKAYVDANAGSGTINNYKGLTLISKTTGIDFKTTGLTTLFTVPVGKTLVITDIIIRNTNSSGVSVSESFNIGDSGSYDQIISGSASQGITDAYSNLFEQGQYVNPPYSQPAGTVIKLNITIGATATTNEGEVYIYGFFTDETASTGIEKLATINGIDGTATGQTTLYTVPAGKSLVVTQIIFRATTITDYTVVNAFGIGITPNYNELVNPASSTGSIAIEMLSNQNRSAIRDGGLSDILSTFVAGDVIKLDIVTAGTATALTFDVDLFGYLI